MSRNPIFFRSTIGVSASHDVSVIFCFYLIFENVVCMVRWGISSRVVWLITEGSTTTCTFFLARFLHPETRRISALSFHVFSFHEKWLIAAAKYVWYGVTLIANAYRALCLNKNHWRWVFYFFLVLLFWIPRFAHVNKFGRVIWGVAPAGWDKWWRRRIPQLDWWSSWQSGYLSC